MSFARWWLAPAPRGMSLRDSWATAMWVHALGSPVRCVPSQAAGRVCLVTAPSSGPAWPRPSDQASSATLALSPGDRAVLGAPDELDGWNYLPGRPRPEADPEAVHRSDTPSSGGWLTLAELGCGYFLRVVLDDDPSSPLRPHAEPGALTAG